MNAETQTHAKMEDSARTHREAFNAHANLDLREKLRNSWVIHYRRNIYRWLQVLWTFGPNLKTIMMMRKMFFVL